MPRQRTSLYHGIIVSWKHPRNDERGGSLEPEDADLLPAAVRRRVGPAQKRGGALIVWECSRGQVWESSAPDHAEHLIEKRKYNDAKLARRIRGHVEGRNIVRTPCSCQRAKKGRKSRWVN